ncbi:hypothetical protein F4802DRAFT_592998 [Xylaria palmicola]|nr:hypothetical protein F4802DRAFT_592998 [Xylaria palmicola]
MSKPNDPIPKMAEPTNTQVPNRPSNPASRLPPSRTPVAPRVDASGLTYKQAASKYTRLMIAMPILLVTSYYLFDRLALGHEAKSLHSAPAAGTSKEMDRTPHDCRFLELHILGRKLASQRFLSRSTAMVYYELPQKRIHMCWPSHRPDFSTGASVSRLQAGPE